MRVFYYIIYYFLVYLIFLIKITAGDETLKREFHSSFFCCLNNILWLEVHQSFQIKNDLKGDRNEKTEEKKI